jgi:8-oxo-dGTP pyrophosphatase MutT (NUDIX family)
MSSTDWAAALRERGDATPAAPRVALWAPSGSARIGSVAPALAQRMALAGLPLHAVEDGWQVGARFDDGLDEALERIARWLSANLLDGRWRGERLAVADDDGTVVGAIERTAVRPLGIATYAVHLVGHTVDGEVWVQQRALDKATDPGRWDTLVGGLVSAGESVLQTLERETWEEAGLRLDALADVHAFGRLTVRRPLAEGYMVEHMHCFEATLPAGMRPVNQDGEVLRFEALSLVALQQRLEADAFTVEAALALLGWLERRGPALQPPPAKR